MRSFYWYCRPLVLLGKLLGVCPLENVLNTNPDKLRYRQCSLSSAYCSLMFFGYIGMIYYFSGFIFNNFLEKFFLHIVVYVILTRSCICWMFCNYHSRKLPTLIRLLDAFDRRKDGFLMQKSYNFLLSFILKIIMPLFFTLVFLLGFFYGTGALYRSIIPPEVHSVNAKWAAMFFGFLSIWQVVPLLLYIYFTVAILHNFHNINFTLREKQYTCNYLSNVKYDNGMADALEKSRLLHNLLAECVTELGNCFGSFLAIDRLCTIIMFVVNIATFLIDDDHNTNLVIVTVLNVLLILSSISCSDKVKEVGGEVGHLLHGIPMSAVDDKTKEEIKLFLLQLSTRPIEISAAGYFVMDRTEIASIMTAVATYLIVIVQFLEDSKYRRCCLNYTDDSWL